VKIKLFLIAISFLTIPLQALPAKADVTSCLNKFLQGELSDIGYRVGEIEAQADYQGVRYHWLSLDSDYPRFKNVEVIIAESDQQGICEMPVHDPGGNMASLEQYEQVLPREVVRKFMKAFQSQ
jgi:hypothetical protein